MTAGEIIGTIFATVLAAVSTAVGWLISSVIKNKESIALQEARVKNLEDEYKELKQEIEKVEAKALTTECVREVVEEALEKRDRLAESRRLDWDRALKSDIRETVRQELDRAVARMTPNKPLKRPPSDQGESDR